MEITLGRINKRGDLHLMKGDLDFNSNRGIFNKLSCETEKSIENALFHMLSQPCTSCPARQGVVA